MNGRRATKHVVPLLGLLLGLALAFTISISLGPVRIPPSTVWRIVLHHVTGIGQPTSWAAIQDNIVWELRLPRTLLGILVGAGLTVTGIMTQTLVRNPLADPYVLGISQGASVGAVATIVLGVGAFGVSSTAGAAFVGAAASFALVYAFARRGGSMAPLRLVLAGVALGFAFNGITQFLVLQADTPGETNTALFWLLGSLAKASWAQLALPTVILTAGTVVLVGKGRALNALTTGDETAASLGIGVERLRRQLFALASLLTGVMVAVSGSIVFVGLIVPHALRMIMGTDHRWLIPAGVLGGAAFLVAVDVIARVALQPQEIPIGVVTGVVGAPVFLWLMSRRREVGGGR